MLKITGAVILNVAKTNPKEFRSRLAMLYFILKPKWRFVDGKIEEKYVRTALLAGLF